MSIVADWHIGVLKEKHGMAIDVPISFIKCEKKNLYPITTEKIGVLLVPSQVLIMIFFL